MYKKVHAIQLIGNKKNNKNIKNYYIKDEEGNILSNKLLYSEIYIDNFVLMYYNKNEEAIEKYKYIIMLGLNLDELTKFNEEYGDEIVDEYVKKFKEIVTIEEFRPLFSKEEDELKIRNSIAAESLKQGIEQGIEQGEKNKQIEIAKEMLSNGLEVDLISKITKLSIEEINNLN